MAILVVDDSRSARSVMCATLAERGFETIEARDGAEAVAMAAMHAPELITMDVQMPAMDGFDACARIRATEQGRLVPIVFVTSKDTLADREKGFHMGASVFISKNVHHCWNEVAKVATRILRPEQQLRNFNVLVLDCNPLTRGDLAHSLARQGGRVLAACSGVEALDQVREHLGEIDMVIADYPIHDLDGADFISILRSKFGLRDVPIIILCGRGQWDQVLEIFRSGATDCIAKPFVTEEFLARVRSHLEVRQLVKELNGTVVELERLSKLRDEFMAVSSHDLKTPLSAIMGYAELLRFRFPEDELHQRALTSILDSAGFMLEIINDVVELNRNQAASGDLPLVPLDPARAIAMAVAGHQGRAREKKIALEQQLEEDPLIIRGERNKFLRILNNLLSNALKFTPAGGRVEVGLRREGDQAVITVTDNGIGIPEDMLPSLFERYTKASRPGTAGEPGTGLGMSITRQLVEQQDGDLGVDSAPGRGTCFRLAFPLARD